MEKALRDFQRALDLDPSFADAAAKIGVAYGGLGQFGFMPSGGCIRESPVSQQTWRLDWTQTLREHTRYSVLYISTMMGIGPPPSGS